MKALNLDLILDRVEKPVRYIGNEYNMVRKDPKDVDIRYAFVFPDIYEVGMSHMGMKILYHLINEREDSYCERVFSPWTDMERELRENNLPLFSLESREPLKSFDFIGFTLQYELSYTNVLNILDLGKIGLSWKDRNEDDPIIMAGGPCAYNVEPMADFFDLVVMGEGEEVINELLDLYSKHKKKGLKKDEFLKAATGIEGIYVPKFYEVVYHEDGLIKSINPIYDDIPRTIKKRLIKDLDKAYYPESMIVPYMDVVHDRVMLEIFRGCTKGCRFCQAGMIYRPVRERSLDNLKDLAKLLIENTGYEEISLASLSTGDYSRLEELVKDLILEFKDKNVSISLPSLRLDSFAKELAEEIQKVKKTGLTFAPEAGSQRMRDIINKGITEDDLIDSLRDAFESGWSGVKLYFMLGLPEETFEDLEGIQELANKIKSVYGLSKASNKPLRLNISTSSFVPKAFTPFQWVGQDSMELMGQKQRFLQKILRIKNVSFSWNNPEASLLEAVFARGDRRLAPLIRTAYEKGCSFDSWDEKFDFSKWMEAFEEEGIDPYFYAERVREKDEVFPWDHIDIGVKKSYLYREYEKALREEITRDCRYGCTACGVNLLGEDICHEIGS